MHTTRWSVVLAAGADSAGALAALCESYWYPLYAFLRRSGHDADEACDLVQGFFAGLLERKDLARVDPARGRFRSFLLVALKHYVVNQRDRARAQKRGGGELPLSLDARDAEARLALDPTDRRPPEKSFEREWALALLDRAMARLAAEQVRAGKSAVFDALRARLSGSDDGDEPQLELAQRLGVTENALRVALHRLRRRYGELVRDEIAQTVSDPADVERELRDLFEALGH
ncbi:MAG: RNA polymerase sigma factor [Planctomycetota bacterium]